MALAAAARHSASKRLADLPRQVIVSEPVRHALRAGKPVVALESTIITHGLPYDVNLAVGRRCESVINKAGATPATIALLDGKVHVGLNDQQLKRLAATAEEGSAGSTKTARRDLPAVLASSKVGGTTVSATAYIASMAGIDFFATGGIGGVHRGAETTFDISSDLTTLSSHPISLFCSGAKSILSLPLTLEYLETQNVPVYSFSQPRGEFPAFYTAKSGLFATPVAGCDEAARIVWTSKHVLQQRAGNLFAVPIPKEFEMQGEALQRNVEEALREAKELGVDQRGKEVTPWLLKRVSELSEGKSLESNEALVVNNAEVAAKTAVEYQRLVDEGEAGQDHDASSMMAATGPGVTLPSSSSPPSILVLGCAALDVSASTLHPMPGSTSSGIVRFALGGVGRNMAEAAQYALADLSRSASSSTSRVRLVAPLVDDVPGRLVRAMMEERGLDASGLLTESPSQAAPSSPVASLVLDGNTNDLQSGVVAMDLVERSFQGQAVRRALDGQDVAPGVVGFDANLPIEGMASLLKWKQEQQAATGKQSVLLYEPTSIEKCTRLIDAVAHARTGENDASAIDVTTPNLVELQAMHRRAVELGLVPATEASNDGDDFVARILTLAAPLTTLCPLVLATIGAQGAVAVHRSRTEEEAKHYHVRPATRLSDAEVKNTTGAGDSFAGAVMAKLSMTPRAESGREEEWIRALVQEGTRAALRSLRSYDAVPRREEGRRIEAGGV